MVNTKLATSSIMLVDRTPKMRVILSSGLTKEGIKLLVADNLAQVFSTLLERRSELLIITSEVLTSAEPSQLKRLSELKLRLFILSPKGTVFDLPQPLQPSVFKYIRVPFNYSILIMVIKDFLLEENPVPLINKIEQSEAQDSEQPTSSLPAPNVQKGQDPTLHPGTRIEEATNIQAGLIDPMDQEYGPLMKIILLKLKTSEVKLPSMPSILVEFDRLIHNPEFVMTDLVQLVEKDPTVSAKILATGMNFLGSVKPPNVSLQHTIVKLGVVRLKNLVHTILLQQEFIVREQELSEVKVRLWKHSLCTANAMRILALAKNDPAADSFYLVGLFHNLGRLFLLEILDKLSKHVAFRKLKLQEKIDLINHFQRHFTQAILTSWRVPGSIVKSILLPSGPSAEPDHGHDYLDFCRHLADYLGYALTPECRYDILSLPMRHNLAVSRDELGRTLVDLTTFMSTIERSL